MTHTEINRRIAKLCGWTEYHSEHRNETRWRDPEGHNWLKPPDYCNDLNACAVFENDTNLDVALYEHYLGEITKTDAMALRRSFVGERFKLATATAQQRCEAFLRVKGEYEE